MLVDAWNTNRVRGMAKGSRVRQGHQILASVHKGLW